MSIELTQGNIKLEYTLVRHLSVNNSVTFPWTYSLVRYFDSSLQLESSSLQLLLVGLRDLGDMSHVTLMKLFLCFLYNSKITMSKKKPPNKKCLCFEII